MRTHAQAAVELENMPFCGIPMAVGGAQLEPLGQVFISAFCFIRHASHSLNVVLAVDSCCLPLWLLMLCPAWSALGCAPAHSTQPGDKSQPTWTIFSFGPSFCALMIIGLISFFHRSRCSPGPLGMHRMLALFVFFSPSLLYYFFCGREIV